MTTGNRPHSRRRFFTNAGLGLVASPLILGRAVRAAETRPPSDRVTAALIGCGGRGMGLLGIHDDPGCTLAAVCDVDLDRLAAAKDRIGGGDAYQDFRRILDRPDIDAVLIATPDHWHAAITVMACQAGKDVYCEKPLCRSIEEGRKMVEAARRYDRVVQMGTQYRSIARSREACEWVRNGRLGQVRTVRLTHPSNPTHPCEPPRQVPANLDWDLWLGPAPWAAYHPARCHFTYRYFMDYGGGALADNGVHMFSVVSWALGADQTGPVTVAATGRDERKNLYDVPVDLCVQYEFADPQFTVIWEQSAGAQLNLEFVGSEATLSGFWDFQVTQGQADLAPTRGDELQLERSDSHSGNWLSCIASRRRPVMDVEIGHRVTCWSHLGNLAYQLGRKLHWDPAAERFVGDDEANRLLHAACRAPWRL
ncbi:MAG: Gfo/Idh/MocA family oxidoreductase [Pirellulaceae bacterium]|jgi:predicted dehydrogenase|nr:Gfo/Idh/MocA family oxidoreductase [Pirellulaceae bacterium]MCU0978018.1 Gfo/Idh/MocA family oxidoreductase [Pirellulaceae bacterium]